MSYSLAEKLFANKPYAEPPVEVLGLKVEFKVPSGGDEDEVIRTIASSSDSFLAMLQLRKIPTLARAIVSIDGVEPKEFDEIKQRLRSLPEYEKMSRDEQKRAVTHAFEAELKGPNYSEEVVSSLYMAYADFRQRHREAISGLKKTSTPPNPATAG